MQRLKPIFLTQNNLLHLSAVTYQSIFYGRKLIINVDRYTHFVFIL